MADFQDAFERVIGGLEKKGTRAQSRSERRTVAYHESGHTLVGYFTPGADPVQKVSIVPRGRGALGYTLQAPLEDRFLMSERRAARAACGRCSAAAPRRRSSSARSPPAPPTTSRRRATSSRQMLTVYGMSKRLPNLSLVENAQGGFLGQGARDMPHSDAIEQTIGDETLELLRTAYEEAKALITERRAQLEALATRLLAQEKVDEKDLLEVLGPRPIVDAPRPRNGARPRGAYCSDAQSPEKRSMRSSHIAVGRSLKTALLSAGPMNQSPRPTSMSSWPGPQPV